MRIWSILLIKSDLKWCIHLSRSHFLYFVKCNNPSSNMGWNLHVIIFIFRYEILDRTDGRSLRENMAMAKNWGHGRVTSLVTRGTGKRHDQKLRLHVLWQTAYWMEVCGMQLLFILLHMRKTVRKTELYSSKEVLNFFNYFLWLKITDEGSIPEIRIFSILLIKSDLKLCVHLSRLNPPGPLPREGPGVKSRMCISVSPAWS